MRSGESRYVGFFLGRGAAGVASCVHVCFVGVRLGRRGGSFLDRQVVSGLGLAGKVGSVLVSFVLVFFGTAGKVGSVLLWYVGMS